MCWETASPTFSGFGEQLFTPSKYGASRAPAAMGTKEVSPGGTSYTAMTPFVTHMACPSHFGHGGNARWLGVLGMWVALEVH